MEVQQSEQEIAQLIAEAFRIELDEDQDSYIYDFQAIGVSKKFSIDKNHLADIIGKIKGLENPQETVIFSPHYIETLVREETNFPRMRNRLRDDSLDIHDSVDDIRYILSSPSDEYLVFLLIKVSSIAPVRSITSPMPPRRIFEQGLSEELNDVFGLLRRLIPRFLTLRIESTKSRPYFDLERYSGAFLFQLSYNLDVSVVPQRYLEEIVRTGRINRIRRSSIDELDVPRRHYIPDLVHQYQLAVGTDNPFLEFVSYYHVAEYFFETVFNEDLVLKIKDKITHPDFSYKRKKDIGRLIKDIGKSLQIRNETITFSEQEALRLTLEKYIDIPDLKNKIDEYDSTLLNYYKDQKVVFSDANEVDLNSPDDTVFKTLANRIYKTRNAIIHSKESDRSKYTPFKDDKELVREIPLLRFIAEQIIINSSTVSS